MPKARTISFAEADEALRYDQETGKLYRKTRTANAIKAGDEAGYYRKDGYSVVSLKNRSWLAHRIVWLLVHGVLPDFEIDHIDGCPSNNRIENLRIADRSLNMMNRVKQRRNTSGHQGVFWSKQKKKWRVQIRVNNVLNHIGLFVNKNDAILVAEKFYVENGFTNRHAGISEQPLK